MTVGNTTLSTIPRRSCANPARAAGFKTPQAEVTHHAASEIKAGIDGRLFDGRQLGLKATFGRPPLVRPAQVA